MYSGVVGSERADRCHPPFLKGEQCYPLLFLWLRKFSVFLFLVQRFNKKFLSSLDQHSVSFLEHSTTSIFASTGLTSDLPESYL